jgi:hypothetical protein
VPTPTEACNGSRTTANGAGSGLAYSAAARPPYCKGNDRGQDARATGSTRVVISLRGLAAVSSARAIISGTWGGHPHIFQKLRRHQRWRAVVARKEGLLFPTPPNPERSERVAAGKVTPECPLSFSGARAPASLPARCSRYERHTTGGQGSFAGGCQRTLAAKRHAARAAPPQRHKPAPDRPTDNVLPGHLTVSGI